MTFLIALTRPAVPSVVMAGDSFDESTLGGVAANTGGSMAILRTTAVQDIRKTASRRSLWVVLLILACAAPVAAQSTQPVWYPPLSLYGRPVAQPFFDFPNWARFSNCRPAPLAWGYDPFPNYGPCDCAPGYSTINCPGDFVAHRASGWYGSADFAPLTMDRLDGMPLARIGPNGANVLTTEDLRTEVAPGGKYTIGRRIFDCYRLEGTYLGYHSWQDQRLVVNSDTNSLGEVGNLSTYQSGFSNPITAGFDGANAVSASVRSNFQSGEINLRYWVDMPPGPFDVSLLVGARYMRIDDQFNFGSLADLPGGGTAVIDTQTNAVNDMWGAQIGIQFCTLITTRWWLDVDLKGGLFNDHVAFTNQDTGNFAPALVTATRDRTAWLGDISLVMNWQMTPNLVLRGGYQALFLNGVTLAHEQNVAPLFANNAGVINDRGKVAYHGPILGIGGNW